MENSVNIQIEEGADRIKSTSSFALHDKELDEQYTDVRDALSDENPNECESLNCEKSNTPTDKYDNEVAEIITDEEYEDANVSASATFEGDLGALLSEFPELATKLAQSFVNTERYAKLRALGLSAEEAYLATSRKHTQNNRSHLVSAVPVGAKSPLGGMTRREMASAKAIFGDLSEREIKSLYNKVTKPRERDFY